MGIRDHCAYNVTRECFLALEVAVDDIDGMKRKELMAKLTLNHGEGFWIAPFTGIPATGGLGIPLDLVYLDEMRIVLDADDSFRTSREAPSREHAATVLALPHHTIYSTQTRPGDQLMICTTDEMVHRLEELSNSADHTRASQSAVILMETPHWRVGGGLRESNDRAAIAKPEHPETDARGQLKPRKTNFNSGRNWLAKWWFPDPRKAKREPVRNLEAYYWNGTRPTAQVVRDIHSTGMYLETEERWYQGTMVLMTLQRTDSGEENGDRAIHVYTRVVRRGKDGVGLQFVLQDTSELPEGLRPPVETADSKQLAQFLGELRKGQMIGAMDEGTTAEAGKPSIWATIRGLFKRAIPARHKPQAPCIGEPGRERR